MLTSIRHPICAPFFMAALALQLAFWACASNAAEPINLVTTHSESRLLELLRREAIEQDIALQASFVDQNQLKSQIFRVSDISSLPDVMIVPSDISRLEMLSIEPLSDDWFISDQNYTLASKLPSVAAKKAIPLFVGNHLLQFFNKALVDHPILDWKELAASYSAPIFSWSYSEMYWFVPFVLTQGTPFLSENLSHLNTPDMVAALRFYKSLAERGAVNQYCNYRCSVKSFMNGETPYHINGTWAIEQLKEALGDNLGVAFLPKFSGYPMRSYYSAHVIVLPALSRHNEAKIASLKSFVKRLQGEQFQTDLMDQSYQLPVNKKALEFLAKQDKSIAGFYVDQLGHSVIMPDSPEMVFIWDALSRGFVRFNAGVLDAPAAARYMEKTYQRFSQQ